MPREERSNAGRVCIFLSRSCGTVSAIIILLCGFITIVPLPSVFAGSISRCIPTGLLIIVCSIITFFLEATVLGFFFEKVAFLVTMGSYVNNWTRFVIYLVFSIVPVFLWCLSASTIVSLGLFFVISALNFILAIGTKGNHMETHSSVIWSALGRQEEGEGVAEDTVVLTGQAEVGSGDMI